VTKSIVRSMRGLSPVIATVILVSVTIVVAVAVAYWMGGIAGLYTRFEKIEITSCYAVKESNGNYTVSVMMKNSGSQDSTVSYVLVNGKPLSEYNGNITSSIPSDGLPIAIGQSQTLTVSIVSGTFEAGTTLDMKFHTAAGKDYPQMLALP